MKLYIFKIQAENKYVKVNRSTLGFRRTKNINDATWWWNKGSARSWEASIKVKFPSVEMIPVDVSFKEIEFEKIK